MHMTDLTARTADDTHRCVMADLAGIHHEHARLAEALAYVGQTARVIRTEGVCDPQRYQEMRRFIDEVALPHLRYEEDELFPRAAALGMPPETLEILRLDHRRLRVLARIATAWGLRRRTRFLPHDAALVIDRFVQAFDEHARHEEALFRELRRPQHDAF